MHRMGTDDSEHSNTGSIKKEHIMQQELYFDNSATTQPYRCVEESMQPYLYEIYGNPSSKYHLSISSKKAIEYAREQIADTLRADPHEIYFTSGGTESDNWALYGVCRARSGHGKHIITTQTEHKAILQCCASLERYYGYEVTYLDVHENGSVDPATLKAALRKDTILVSIMTANNEVGTINSIQELAEITHRNGTLFHTDAVQAYCHIPLASQMEHVDLLSASGHKFHGPKGVGFLYIRRGTPIEPLIYGGDQESGLRSGTENTASIVGIGCAAEKAHSNLRQRTTQVHRIQKHIIQRVLSEIPDVILTGDPESRLPHHASFCFDDISGLLLIDQLAREHIYISNGSACSNNDQVIRASHVLLAMGIPEDIAHGSIRITCSEFNTEEEADFLIERLKQKISELRQWT